MSDTDARERVALLTSTDVVTARHRARALAQAAGLSLVAQTKLVTAVSELARNCVDYGGGGEIQLAAVRETRPPFRTGIRVVVADDGPGIADLDLALTDGWSSGHGLGLGLPGSRKLAHEFAIETAPGAGTTVTLAFWRA